MVETTKQLRLDLERALARISALEEIVYPSGSHDGVEAVRIHLRKVRNNLAKLSPQAVDFLRERLSRDWRDLIRVHGHQPVFALLAQDCDIVDARRQLEADHHA